jgi:uncharacterized protein (TIGR03067 family)
MRPRLLLAAATVLLLAGGSREDEARKELKKFAGAWALASGEVDGEKLADEHVKKSKITWEGSKVMLLTPHQSKEPIRADITLDPAKRPRHMDWVRSTEPGKGKRMQAIYEWLGDDRYRVCFAPPGKGRPTEFKTRPGSGHTLHVWKRARD